MRSTVTKKSGVGGKADKHDGWREEKRSMTKHEEEEAAWRSREVGSDRS